MVDGLAQNVSDIAFINTDRLQLNIEDIDFGDKRFIFEDVRDLTLSGKALNKNIPCHAIFEVYIY